MFIRFKCNVIMYQKASAVCDVFIVLLSECYLKMTFFVYWWKAILVFSVLLWILKNDRNYQKKISFSTEMSWLSAWLSQHISWLHLTCESKQVIVKIYQQEQLSRKPLTCNPLLSPLHFYVYSIECVYALAMWKQHQTSFVFCTLIYQFVCSFLVYNICTFFLNTKCTSIFF